MVQILKITVDKETLSNGIVLIGINTEGSLKIISKLEHCILDAVK